MQASERDRRWSLGAMDRSDFRRPFDSPAACYRRRGTLPRIKSTDDFSDTETVEAREASLASDSNRVARFLQLETIEVEDAAGGCPDEALFIPSSFWPDEGHALNTMHQVSPSRSASDDRSASPPVRDCSNEGAARRAGWLLRARPGSFGESLFAFGARRANSRRWSEESVGSDRARSRVAGSNHGSARSLISCDGSFILRRPGQNLGGQTANSLARRASDGLLASAQDEGLVRGRVWLSKALHGSLSSVTGSASPLYRQAMLRWDSDSGSGCSSGACSPVGAPWPGLMRSARSSLGASMDGSVDGDEPGTDKSKIAMMKSRGVHGSFLIRAPRRLRSRRVSTMTSRAARAKAAAVQAEQRLSSWRAEMFDRCLFALIDIVWLLSSVGFIVLAGMRPQNLAAPAGEQDFLGGIFFFF